MYLPEMGRGSVTGGEMSVNCGKGALPKRKGLHKFPYP